MVSEVVLIDTMVFTHLKFPRRRAPEQGQALGSGVSVLEIGVGSGADGADGFGGGHLLGAGLGDKG